MKDPMKLAQCISQCKFLNHSITFIQETHIFGQSTTKFDDRELCGWTFINSGLKSKASAGVGIALSPDVKLIDIDSTKEKFFSTLSLAIQKVKREHPGFKVLVGADMNATIGNDSFGPWSYLGPNNDEYATNDNGTRLLSLSNENNIFIMNSLFPSKAIHRHMWYSPTGFSKRVDYILAEWHLKKLCSNCRVYRKASIPFETNHRLLILSCSFPSKRKQKQFFSQISKPIKPHKNISLLHNDPDVCNNFSNKLDDLSVDPPINNDVNVLESVFTESIIQASESEIPKFEASAKK
jgi:exonuclease III